MAVIRFLAKNLPPGTVTTYDPTTGSGAATYDPYSNNAATRQAVAAVLTTSDNSAQVATLVAAGYQLENLTRADANAAAGADATVIAAAIALVALAVAGAWMGVLLRYGWTRGLGYLGFAAPGAFHSRVACAASWAFVAALWTCPLATAFVVLAGARAVDAANALPPLTVPASLTVTAADPVLDTDAVLDFAAGTADRQGVADAVERVRLMMEYAYAGVPVTTREAVELRTARIMDAFYAAPPASPPVTALPPPAQIAAGRAALLATPFVPAALQAALAAPDGTRRGTVPGLVSALQLAYGDGTALGPLVGQGVLGLMTTTDPADLADAQEQLNGINALLVAQQAAPTSADPRYLSLDAFAGIFAALAPDALTGLLRDARSVGNLTPAALAAAGDAWTPYVAQALLAGAVGLLAVGVTGAAAWAAAERGAGLGSDEARSHALRLAVVVAAVTAGGLLVLGLVLRRNAVAAQRATHRQQNLAALLAAFRSAAAALNQYYVDADNAAPTAPDVQALYLAYRAALAAFDACGELFPSARRQVPFPFVQLLLWAGLAAGLVAALLLIGAAMRPLELWRALGQMASGATGVAAPPLPEWLRALGLVAVVGGLLAVGAAAVWSGTAAPGPYDTCGQ